MGSKSSPGLSTWYYGMCGLLGLFILVFFFFTVWSVYLGMYVCVDFKCVYYFMEGIKRRVNSLSNQFSLVKFLPPAIYSEEEEEKGKAGGATWICQYFLHLSGISSLWLGSYCGFM